MTTDVAWLRRRLAKWRPALGQGEGVLGNVKGRVWRLDWQGCQYCVKAPRLPEERTLEATLQQALHSAGHSVPQVHWEDEQTGVFVMEWVDGPSLEDVLRRPKSEERDKALAECVHGLADLEEGSDVVQTVMGCCEPVPPDPHRFAVDLVDLCTRVARDLEVGPLQAACEAVAAAICVEPPRPLGVVDILPRDVILGRDRAVFLDVWPTGWWWSERRFCHYFARFQQDAADRSFQSACFLRTFATSTAQRLDAHYLWHDLQHLCGWQEIRDSPTERTRPDDMVDWFVTRGRQRLTWTGAFAAANVVRALLQGRLIG